jgi:hypothetical protein
MPSARPQVRFTPQQRRFVDYYVTSFNALDSARRAGYSQNDSGAGSRVLAMPQVRAEIHRRCLQIQQELQVTGNDLRSLFARIAFNPLTAEEGGPTWGDRISAARELGKLMGLYIERGVMIGATLEQLLALADKRAEPAALEGPKVA